MCALIDFLLFFFNRNARTRPTLIVAQLIFDNDIILPDVRDLLETKLLTYHRFRSALTYNKAKPILDDVEFKLLDKVDMSYHVTAAGEGEKWSQYQINDFVSKLYTENMDHSRPLWRFFVINHMADGRHMLLAVIDHSIGDGVTMVEVLLGMVEEDQNDSTQAAVSIKPNDDMSSSKQKNCSRFSTLISGAIFLDGCIRGVIGTLLPADPPNLLKLPNHRNPGTQKCMATTGTIPLQEVKDFKAKFPGTTINDIFATLVTMCVRKYLEEQGDPILKSGRTIRAAFAINTRSKAQPIRRQAPHICNTPKGSMAHRHLRQGQRTPFVLEPRGFASAVRAA
jgi:NRPS condensation-like uncharacterized protein